MQIQNQQFVILSELFEGFEEIRSWWHDMDHTDFTWGDCSRSMIRKEDFLSEITESELEIARSDGYLANTTPEQISAFFARVESLGTEVMIDLEN